MMASKTNELFVKFLGDVHVEMDELLKFLNEHKIKYQDYPSLTCGECFKFTFKDDQDVQDAISKLTGK